jgi:hypothetical protein
MLAARIGLLVAIVLALLTGCKKVTEEDRVRAVIRKAIAAANARSASGVVEDAADGFRGPQNMRKDEVKGMIAAFLLGAGWVHVFERALDVTLEPNGTKATAKLEALLARGQEVKKIEDVLPTNAAEVVFTLELERIGAEWRFTHADYTQKP